MLKVPCQSCNTREMMCHTHCEKYKSYQKELQARNFEIWKKKKMEYDIKDFKSQVTLKEQNKNKNLL